MALGGVPRGCAGKEGGWGWVVVASTALAALIQAIMVQAFGVLYLEMLRRYSASATATAWVGALNMVSVGLFGPVASALCNRFGCRAVGAAGGIMTGVGIIVTAYAPNIIMVYATFGILAGSGICLTVTSGYILLAKYFEQRRAFAMSLTALGPGIGLMVFPTVMMHFFKDFGYAGATIMLGAFCFNASVAGALYRPKDQTKHKQLTPPPDTCKVEYVTNGGKTELINENQGKQSPIYKGPLIPMNTKPHPDESTCDGADEALLQVNNSADSALKGENQRDQPQNGKVGNTPAVPQQEEKPLPPQKPKIFDFNLLKNPTFVAMCFVYFNVTMNNGLATAFLPAFAIDRGIEPQRAAFLLSIGGITAIFGVLGLGLILDLPRVKTYRSHLFNTFNVLLALSSLLTPVCWTYGTLAATAALRGVFAATLMVQRATVSADLVGLRRVPSAFGLLTFSNALGSLVGRPLGGIVRDELGDFGASFYVSGALGLLSSIVFLVTYLRNQSEQRKRDSISDERPA